MALSEYANKLLNRSPADVVIEQLKKLYMRLYPHIVQDFVHYGDLRIAIAELNAQIASLQAALASHTHNAEGTPTSPAIGVPSATTPVIPAQSVGLALVLPAGLPQPTGEGIALVPSKVGSPDEVIALPPLSPTDLL